MQLRTKCLLVLLILQGLGVAQVDAQTSSVDWQIRPVIAADEGNAYRIFSGQSLSVELRLLNEDESKSAVVVEGGFFQAVAVSIIRSDRSPVATVDSWELIAECGGAFGPSSCTTTERVVLGPGQWVRATANLSVPAPGVLEEGNYRLVADFAGSRQRLLGADSKPWSGRLLGTGGVAISVSEVKTPEDRKTFLRLTAGNAMARGQFASALSTYLTMQAEFPDDVNANAGVGIALLRTGRFAEAATALERALPLNRNAESTIPVSLAQAYLRLGQEAKAVDVLKGRYPPARVTELIESLKRQNAAAPTRGR